MKRKEPSSKKPRVSDEFPVFNNGREFDALSAEDKEKVWNYYNREIPLSETREPTAEEKATLKRIRRKAGRPKIGQGAKVVAVTLERGFLKRVDDYARKHELKRAEMIARGLRIVMEMGDQMSKTSSSRHTS